MAPLKSCFIAFASGIGLPGGELGAFRLNIVVSVRRVETCWQPLPGLPRR
jgi:hypothetical protein